MLKQDVQLGKASTQLWLGSACRDAFCEHLAKSERSLAVISDSNVEKAWRERLDLDCPWLVVPAGERSKSVESIGRLWSELVGLGLDRQSAILAIGGGVVGDLAGFAASTYMRGVDFFSLPTSLLAMVDASVGGKVGIDLAEGKNLVGQFYPAQIVAVDPELLMTLPLEQWAQGMAEVIKHGILQGPDLWQSLVDFHPDQRQEMIKVAPLVEAAVGVKLRVVEQDPYERTGLRATLNLGHTYAHAIEWCSSFGIDHGEAVALGLLAGLRLSRELGLLEKDFEDDLKALIARWGLPHTLPEGDPRFSWDKLTQGLARDKKNKGGKWVFILPRRLGEVTQVVGPPQEAVKNAYLSLFSKADS